MDKGTDDPLFGITPNERIIMDRLLRTTPEQQKTTPKPIGAQADAQRRRREKERHTPTAPLRGA